MAITWQCLEMPSAGDVPVLEHELWCLPVQYFSLPTAKTQKTELGTEWVGERRQEKLVFQHS